MEDYLKNLNDQQKEAVTYTEGPLMIVAGAGSGKTKVLTTRIAHLMNKGVDPFHILALTFTNKAAKEMKERILHILGDTSVRNLYVGTFHSIFARILRGEAASLGYPSSFTIYDSDDSRSVIKSILKEMNLDEKIYKPSSVQSRISWAKNALIPSDDYINRFDIRQDDMRAQHPALGKIYMAYEQRCFKNGAMDFDDLLVKMLLLLRTDNAALVKYQRRFQYILIDEYQDTNPVQYEIAKLLAAMNENICVVGDDAQSIYSFRGATIENILQFRKDYDNVKVVKLEQNYRCSKSILGVANEVIKNNEDQIEKKLWTENPIGEKIRVVKTMTDHDEGKFVSETIQEQKLRYHFSNKDFAILYRTNAQSRSFEESLRRQGISYKIYGGMSFYQRKEVKDLIAYLRLVVNVNDEEALKRIINYPLRGIGKTTIEKCLTFAHEKEIPFWQVLVHAKELGLRGGVTDIISKFVTMIQYFKSLLNIKNAYEIAVEVGKHTGIVRELYNDKTTEGLMHYENIQELLNSIKEWTELPDTIDGEVNSKDLGAYLQQITLLTDADDENQDNDVVRLMTIHAAKGLEFGCVFLAGVEENIFPSALSVNTRQDLEEERRLYYVAVTRAKNNLWISYANTRYRFGNLVQNDPSRFLEEMPEQYLDRSYARSTLSSNAHGDSSYNYGGYRKKEAPSEAIFGPEPKKKKENFSYMPLKTQPKPVPHVPSKDFVASDITEIEMGLRVEHQKFGYGVVKRIEGSDHNPIALINFEQNGEKKIMLQYAKIRVVK